jgi:hypothetical protein
MQQPGPYAQQPAPYDPYRAQPPAPAFSPIGSTTRWIYVAIVSVMGLGFGIAVFAWTLALIRSEHTPDHRPDDTMIGIGFVGFMVLILLLYAQIATGLVWIYKAWGWLPWDQRYTRHWKSWITPGGAALMMLIPYFHYYWMFVVNVGLCDALDRLRVSYPTRDPAPKNLAIAACVCQLLIPFPVGSILWLVFMGKVERMTREMSAAMVPRATNAF